MLAKACVAWSHKIENVIRTQKARQQPFLQLQECSVNSLAAAVDGLQQHTLPRRVHQADEAQVQLTPPHTHTLIHAEPCSLAAAVDGLQHALSRRVYQADEAQESEARCELLLVSGAVRLVILSVDDPVLCVARKKGREY